MHITRVHMWDQCVHLKKQSLCSAKTDWNGIHGQDASASPGLQVTHLRYISVYKTCKQDFQKWQGKLSSSFPDFNGLQLNSFRCLLPTVCWGGDCHFLQAALRAAEPCCSQFLSSTNTTVPNSSKTKPELCPGYVQWELAWRRRSQVKTHHRTGSSDDEGVKKWGSEIS